MTTDWLNTPRTRHTQPPRGRTLPHTGRITLTDDDTPTPFIDHVVMERLVNGEPSEAKCSERAAAGHYLHHHRPELSISAIARTVGTTTRTAQRWATAGWPNPADQQEPSPTLTRKETTTMHWQHRAACINEDPDLFYPIGETGPALLQAEKAKAVCRRCPVADACLADALRSERGSRPDSRHGIRGGLDGDERYSLYHRRNKQRAKQRQQAAVAA